MRCGGQGAKYVAAVLESLGAEIKMAHGPCEDTNPVVLGRIGRDASRPTILFYGAPRGKLTFASSLLRCVVCCIG